MSEEQKAFFEQRYREMSTEELVVLSNRGNLTEVASEVLEKVLSERGVAPESREELIKELKEESRDEQFKHLASLGDRLLGQIIDNIVALFVGAGLFLVAKLIFNSEGLAVFSGFCGWLLYNLLSDGLSGGQSVGKRITKTAVVYGGAKTPCTFWRSFARNITLLVLGLIDWVFIFGDSHKRLGDHIAGTEVIKIKKDLVVP